VILRNIKHLAKVFRLNIEYFSGKTFDTGKYQQPIITEGKP
jgi:hypothetical protein